MNRTTIPLKLVKNLAQISFPSLRLLFSDSLLGDGANNSLEKDEAEIFFHLTTFFSRYYDGGDFMSLRRYKQETYSPLPMNGEEVKLHWANADQYYIKSDESFSNYAFKLGGCPRTKN